MLQVVARDSETGSVQQTRLFIAGTTPGDVLEGVVYDDLPEVF